MKIYVSGSLSLAIFKEGRVYVAYAPALDLVSQGKSAKEAQKKFAEVFDIYLEETLGRGTLEKDLLKCGWNKHGGSLQPPAVASFPAPERIGKDIELTALAILPFNENRLCQA